jgi:hypothetical protein
VLCLHDCLAEENERVCYQDVNRLSENGEMLMDISCGPDRLKSRAAGSQGINQDTSVSAEKSPRARHRSISLAHEHQFSENNTSHKSKTKHKKDQGTLRREKDRFGLNLNSSEKVQQRYSFKDTSSSRIHRILTVDTFPFSCDDISVQR